MIVDGQDRQECECALLVLLSAEPTHPVIWGALPAKCRVVDIISLGLILLPCTLDSLSWERSVARF